MNNNRKKSKKVPKPLFKSNQNSKMSKINHNQMINKFRKIKKLKKQINRITMIKRNELKLEKGVKVKNKERKEAPIIVDRSQIVHKGSILSYRGQEEVKSRSKNQMKEMIIKEGSKHRIKQVTSQIKVGKDQKLTLIDLPRLLPKPPHKEVNLKTSMHHKLINRNQCPSMLMLLNSYIRKSRQASKILQQHINYHSRLKVNPKQTLLQRRNSRRKNKDQFTHLNSFSVLSSKTNRDRLICQSLIFLTKREDPI